MCPFFCTYRVYIYEWINNRWFKRKDFLKASSSFKFSDDVSAFLWKKAKAKIRQLVTVNKKGEAKLAAGFEMMGIKDEILEEIRKGLPGEYIIFITNFEKKKKNVGIIKGYDKFSILKTMQTSGEKYNISNGKLINDLKMLDKKFPFSIIGAGSDWWNLLLRHFADIGLSWIQLRIMSTGRPIFRSVYL